ncbi:MAG: hypothetical protein AAFN92_17910, partial [Bacteroidota bacterium]
MRFIVFLFCIFLTATVAGQLEVGNTLGTIGINTAPSAGIRLSVLEDQLATTARLTTYGTSDVEQTGLYNVMRYGTGKKTGIHNYIAQDVGNTTPVIGLQNNLLPNTTGAITGVDNLIRNGTANTITGIYNFINTPSGSTAGYRFGVNTLLKGRWNGTTYGSRIRIVEDQNATGTHVYGLYAELTGSGPAVKYGVYSKATAPNSYAGYFHGKTHFTQALTCEADAELKRLIVGGTSNLTNTANVGIRSKSHVNSLLLHHYNLNDDPQNRTARTGIHLDYQGVYQPFTGLYGIIKGYEGNFIRGGNLDLLQYGTGPATGLQIQVRSLMNNGNSTDPYQNTIGLYLNARDDGGDTDLYHDDYHTSALEARISHEFRKNSYVAKLAIANRDTDTTQ